MDGAGIAATLAGVQAARFAAFECQRVPCPVLRALRPDLRSTALFALQKTPAGTTPSRG